MMSRLRIPCSEAPSSTTDVSKAKNHTFKRNLNNLSKKKKTIKYLRINFKKKFGQGNPFKMRIYILYK